MEVMIALTQLRTSTQRREAQVQALLENRQGHGGLIVLPTLQPLLAASSCADKSAQVDELDFEPRPVEEVAAAPAPVPAPVGDVVVVVDKRKVEALERSAAVRRSQLMATAVAEAGEMRQAAEVAKKEALASLQQARAMQAAADTDKLRVERAIQAAELAKKEALASLQQARAMQATSDTGKLRVERAIREAHEARREAEQSQRESQQALLELETQLEENRDRPAMIIQLNNGRIYDNGDRATPAKQVYVQKRHGATSCMRPDDMLPTRVGKSSPEGRRSSGLGKSNSAGGSDFSAGARGPAATEEELNQLLEMVEGLALRLESKGMLPEQLPSGGVSDVTTVQAQAAPPACAPAANLLQQPKPPLLVKMSQAVARAQRACITYDELSLCASTARARDGEGASLVASVGSAPQLRCATLEELSSRANTPISIRSSTCAAPSAALRCAPLGEESSCVSTASADGGGGAMPVAPPVAVQLQCTTFDGLSSIPACAKGRGMHVSLSTAPQPRSGASSLPVLRAQTPVQSTTRCRNNENTLQRALAARITTHLKHTFGQELLTPSALHGLNAAPRGLRDRPHTREGRSSSQQQQRGSNLLAVLKG